MENPHCSWENPLFLWPFSIVMLVYQRVTILPSGNQTWQLRIAIHIRFLGNLIYKWRSFNCHLWFPKLVQWLHDDQSPVDIALFAHPFRFSLNWRDGKIRSSWHKKHQKTSKCVPKSWHWNSQGFGVPPIPRSSSGIHMYVFYESIAAKLR